jgi:uroporphyrinogen-III synthase
LPAYAVGAHTREAAVAAGFAEAASAEGDVDALARLIATMGGGAGLPLIYFAAGDRAGDLAGALGRVGQAVETVIAYRAVAVGGFDADLRAAIAGGEIDAVLHYSARTASAFVAAAKAAGLSDSAMKIRHLCLSAQVARPLAASGAAAVIVAAAPDEDALLALIDMP